MASVELVDVTVVAGETVLLDGVTLRLDSGERVALIGPSGSGKSTILRTIAGLIPVDTGEVRIDEQVVTDVPTRARDVAMVFETAPLLPHLNVRRNLAFPLRLRRRPDEEVRQRVTAEARAMGLEDLLERRPATLSSGERHATATAHALVRTSRVLLLDEPLAQIDVHRRADIRRELVELQEGYGVTFLLATNDPQDAMSMANRLAVVDRGRLVQVDTVTRCYAEPASLFVADLLGEDLPLNRLPARVTRGTRGAVVHVGDAELPTRRLPRSPRQVIVGVRPEDLRPDGGGVPLATGTVVDRRFAGARVHVTFDLDGGGEAHVAVRPPGPAVGDRVLLSADPGKLHTFDVSGTAIQHGL